MEALVNAGCVLERQDPYSCGYRLMRADLLDVEAYRQLREKHPQGFARCSRTRAGDVDELLYDVEDCTPLHQLLPQLDAPAFLGIVSRVLQGFEVLAVIPELQPQNVEIALDRLYVSDLGEVRLIYLPISQAYASSMNQQYEAHLKYYLSWAVQTYPALQTEDTRGLYELLQDPTVTLHTLRQQIVTPATGSGNVPEEAQPAYSEPAQGYQVAEPQQDVYEQQAGAYAQQQVAYAQPAGGYSGAYAGGFSPSILLEGVGTPEPVQMLVTKPEFLIGKKVSAVDGALSFNPAISRVHCKIIWDGGQYGLVDLGSANATRINGQKLDANVSYPLQVGDAVRMANSDFVVRAV